MGFYMRYMNEPRKLANKPHQWRPKVSTQAPGHIGDPKNKNPGGMRRFQRWYGRPLRAWKLYWRQSKLHAKTPNVRANLTKGQQMKHDEATVQPTPLGQVERVVRALPEPLPCPFCGRQPELDNPDTLYPTGTGWKPFRGFRSYVGFLEVPKEQWCYGMHCCQCCGGCGAEIHADSAAEAIQRWNRRPDVM